MTQECPVCSEEHTPANLVEVDNGRVCSRCYDALFVDEPTTSGTTSPDDRAPALEAFADAIEFFHEQLDRPITDHQSGAHADRPDTAREYFERERGWTSETVDAKRLGWAPANETALLDYLMHEGYDRDAILGTGLFTQDLRPLWQGRYVLPYCDGDARPVYAISRATGREGGGAAGYDGHPADFMSGKYAKPAHTKEYVAVTEPVYGLETVESGAPLLITEGIADAITAHERGYACISPVTTQFKHHDRERLRTILEDRDIERVYVVQDAERPTSDVDEEGRLTVEQFGPGVKGAVATAASLVDHGVDARVAELPRPGLAKVDLDDYLRTWSRHLSPILASAKPPADHPAHDPYETAVRTPADHRAPVASDGRSSALFDLDITDVTDLAGGYRGTNPLGHHGQSENYFVLTEETGIAYDHKHKVGYNALTYLLCEAGARTPASPNGALDDAELFAAWRHAKHQGRIPEDDPIPHAALRHVAVEAGVCTPEEIEDGWRLPSAAYRTAVERVREEYGVDPGRAGSGDSDGEPTATLPLGQLDALSPEDRRRYARNRGHDWPTTDQARTRLQDTIEEVMRGEEYRVVDAPTALGKTHTVAATDWGTREDITGARPVVHLLETRAARDEAVATAAARGGEYFVLRSRHEACPVAAGTYDPAAVADDPDREPVTIDGTPASDYLTELCDRRGIHFGAAHRHLDAHNDQGVDLPCTAEGPCPAIQQWEDLREGPQEGEHWQLIIATHNFAFVPGLRMHANVVVDEEPDYRQDLSTDRVRRAVSAFLDYVDCPLRTFADLLHAGRHGLHANEHRAPVDYGDVEAALQQEPDRDWFFAHPDAHALAPALARAIFYAETRANGRRVGKTLHEPPRLDARARDAEGWNREWVTVVLDDANEVRTVRAVPDFGGARAVIGLDAHPALPKWQANTVPWIRARAVLAPEERQLWRRYERGLRVVQVGDATRPLTTGEYFDEAGTRAVLEQLHVEYGPRFRTALTAKRVGDELRRLMADVGIPDPAVMTYGQEKSRNDFAGEPIGFVNGCIDPGDDHVLDLLAELDLDATPERSNPEDCNCAANAACDHCDGSGCRACLGTGLKRARGRGFTGEDAETAATILASVRENHTAQAAGRYARAPDDPGETATVFVGTDASPSGFADLRVPGAVWTYSATQKRVVETLRESTRRLSARDIAEEADCSKEHVRTTLQRLADQDAVHAFESAGAHGATLYADSGLPTTGVVDLGNITNDCVLGPRTWALAIHPADGPGSKGDESRSGLDAAAGPAWDWRGAVNGGEPPPE